MWIIISYFSGKEKSNACCVINTLKQKSYQINNIICFTHSISVNLFKLKEKTELDEPWGYCRADYVSELRSNNKLFDYQDISDHNC